MTLALREARGPWVSKRTVSVLSRGRRCHGDPHGDALQDGGSWGFLETVMREEPGKMSRGESGPRRLEEEWAMRGKKGQSTPVTKNRSAQLRTVRAVGKQAR